MRLCWYNVTHVPAAGSHWACEWYPVTHGPFSPHQLPMDQPSPCSAQTPLLPPGSRLCLCASHPSPSKPNDVNQTIPPCVHDSRPARQVTLPSPLVSTLILVSSAHDSSALLLPPLCPPPVRLCASLLVHQFITLNRMSDACGNSPAVRDCWSDTLSTHKCSGGAYNITCTSNQRKKACGSCSCHLLLLLLLLLKSPACYQHRQKPCACRRRRLLLLPLLPPLPHAAAVCCCRCCRRSW